MFRPFIKQKRVLLIVASINLMLVFVSYHSSSFYSEIDYDLKIEASTIMRHALDHTYDEPMIRLYDIKTIGGFAWSVRFSKTKPVESGHHYLQLGTYGLALKEKYGNLNSMSLIYYNKDTSVMRESVVPLMYLDEARRYWHSINQEHAKGLPMFKHGTSPVHKWVCNYCQFKKHCNPPSI